MELNRKIKLLNLVAYKFKRIKYSKRYDLLPTDILLEHVISIVARTDEEKEFLNSPIIIQFLLRKLS